MSLLKKVLWSVTFPLLLAGCRESGSESAAGTRLPVQIPRIRPTPAPCASLFAEDQLPSFHLSLDAKALNRLRNHPRQYQSGTLRYLSEDGFQEIILNKVGIRLKGNFTFMGLRQKPAFKVKMSEFVPGQRLIGLRRLTLNNMAQDPSYLRERLAYAVYREVGAPAPLCNHARVYLNREYYGLYANVESLDESFLERYESPAEGNLYDTRGNRKKPHIDIVPKNVRRFQLETNRASNDTSDLKRLMQGLQGSGEAFWRFAARAIDLEEFLQVGAVQAVIADWDGYFGSSNNYKIYHATSTRRFWLLPWGTDQAFNIWGFHHNKLDYAIDASNLQRPHGIFFRRCLDHPPCRAAYLHQVGETLDRFESMDLHLLVDRILEQSGAAIEEDIRAQELPHHSLEAFEASVEAVREFIDHRGDRVFEQLTTGKLAN